MGLEVSYPHHQRGTREQVNLEENEVAAMLTALNSYIPELREEIGKTEATT